MRALATIAAALLSISLPSIVVAQDFDRGMSAYNAGDYTTAMRDLRPLAEQGNANAQTILGAMYENGQGVPQDRAEAVRWYRLAAEQGDEVGQYNLGRKYEEGRGVPRNYQIAYMWLNLAAAQGSTSAAQNRNSVAERMTPEQLARAQQLSQECLARNYQGCAE